MSPIASDNLYDEFVTQPGPEYVSEHVELDLRNSDFNGCIGAVDGSWETHIPALNVRLIVAMDNLKRLDSGDIAV
ncbi:hypothetical protein E4U51_006012 [Claviceps purpurea]|nr:hypothetical protein E4U51_006012 [Claviceps purpurea]